MTGKDDYLHNFDLSEEAAELHNLAKEYHEKVDQYDSIVCSGTSVRGEPMPLSHAELIMVNSNARYIRKSILWNNPHVNPQALNKAIKDYYKNS